MKKYMINMMMNQDKNRKNKKEKKVNLKRNNGMIKWMI